MCEISYELTTNSTYSSYGWYGSYILVYDAESGDLLDYWTENNGGTTIGTFNVCDGRALTFSWYSANANNDQLLVDSYTIYDAKGEIITSNEGPMTSDFDYTVDCTIPACIKPSNFAYSNLTARTVDLSWTANGTEEAWQISYNTRNDVPENGTILDLRSNTYTLQRLTPETAYYVYVRANCDTDGYSDWTNVLTFTTEPSCPAPNVTVSDLEPFSATISWEGEGESYNLRYTTSDAFVYDFESAEPWTITDFDPCTTYDGDGGATYGFEDLDFTNMSYTGSCIAFQSGLTDNLSAHSGNAFGMMVSSRPSTIQNGNANNDWFILPAITIERDFVFSFWAREITTTYGPEIINVGIYRGEGTMATYLDEELEISETEWTKHSYDLSAYAEQTIQLAINYVSADIFGFMFDDIFVGNPNPSSWIESFREVRSPFALERLNEETLYYVEVQADCGSEDGTSAWAGVFFTTPSNCAAPTDLTAEPTYNSATLTWTGYQDNYNLQYREAATRETLFFDGFNNSTAEGFIYDGSFIYGLADAVYNIPSDQNYFLAMGWSSTEEEYIISPELPDFASGSTVEFYQRYYSSVNTFQVGFSSTTTDVNAFTWGDPINASGTFSLYSEVIPDGTKYIGIKATASSQYYCIFIDNFGIYTPYGDPGAWTTVSETTTPYTIDGLLTPETDYEWQVQGINRACENGVTEWSAIASFTTLVACEVPTDLEEDEVTTTTAVITWVSEAVSFDIELDGTVIEEGVTETSYTIENLDPGTIYQVRVNAHCDNGSVSEWSNAYTFSTLCEAFDLPYSYDFETSDDMICWTYYSYNSDNRIGLTCEDDDCTNIVFFFSSYYETSDYYDQILISPELNALEGVTVEFNYRTVTTQYGAESFMVGYSDGSNFTWGDTIYVENVDEWATFTETYPAGTKYVAIYYLSEYLTYLFLDDFNFTVPEATTTTQTVELEEGWNWFSTYIDLGDPIALLQMLEEGLDENGLIIQSFTDGVTEYDEEWFGDLDDIGIVNNQTYMIYTSSDCSFELEGPATDPTQNHITITPGWNWIGFPCNQEVAIEDAFAGFTPNDEDLFQSSNGVSQYDGEEWFGDIEYLIPGEGYMYYSTRDEEVELVFQTGTAKVKHLNRQFFKKRTSNAVQKIDIKIINKTIK